MTGNLRPVDDELEIEATVEADHRQLGVTWNVLGTVRTPSRLVVRGLLVAE